MAPKGEITPDTRVPLSTTIAICIFVAAVAGWASRVESGISAWAKTRQDVDSNSKRLSRVQGDLRLIKDKLGIPKDKRADPDPDFPEDRE